MKRFISTLLFVKLLLWGCALARGDDLLSPAEDPAAAVVRIKSHGASATIIGTLPGKSYLLGCAHMFEDGAGNPSEAQRRKKMLIDGPPQPRAPRKLGAARLLAFDHALDLSLIEIDNGPFSYIPVAPSGHRPSRDIRSLGFDNMAWPVTDRPATIVATEGDTTYTREKPWHGRSGGGLIDREHRCLIGVVQGYEVAARGRGVYVSHAAILRFLGKHRPQLLAPPPPAAGRQAMPRCLPGGV